MPRWNDGPISFSRGSHGTSQPRNTRTTRIKDSWVPCNPCIPWLKTACPCCPCVPRLCLSGSGLRGSRAAEVLGAIGGFLRQRIADRHEQQRQEQTQRLAADDRDGDAGALRGAGADPERGRDQAGDDRARSSSGSAAAASGRLDQRLAQRHPLRAAARWCSPPAGSSSSSRCRAAAGCRARSRG